MNLTEFLKDLSIQKVELWREGEQLRYRGPKEVVTPELLNQIKQYKQEILAWLVQQESSTKVYPLSEGQKALWFLYKLAPKSSSYNVAFTARIRSSVDIPVLKETFQRLSDRHSTLRTTFREEEGKPVQKVHPHQEVYFEVFEASQWNWEELHQQVFAVYERPFDLETGPVMRVSLFRRSERDYILLLTIHHIACDAWSLWMLLDELRQVYPTVKSGSPLPLPELRRTYFDFARWQEQMLASSQGERLWDYWKQKLAGELPILHLPTERSRPPIQTYKGASSGFNLSRELSQQLRELARNEGTTLYTLLLTALEVLLSRYSGQTDILIGSPTAGRTQAEFENLFGYFVNPTVIRADLSNNPTFKTLLAQTRQNVLEAITHQDYPFPLLVRHLQPKRDPSYPPLFQVDFVLQQPQQLKDIANLLIPSEKPSQLDWGGLILEPFVMVQQIGQFDLGLEMVETQETLFGVFKYNIDLFEETTIKRMIGHFQTLLEGIVVYPEKDISELPILTEAERQQLLFEWNDTQIEYPQDKFIHQLFEEQVEKTADAVAMVFEEEQLTYRELNCRANQLAHYLQTLRVGPEVLVGICVERSLEMVVGLLGILKAGGAYVPLDPTYPQERLAQMIEDSQVTALLTQEKLVKHLPQHQAQVLCLDTDWTRIASGSQANPVARVNPENLAYVIYTSGSTGKPKGAMNTHRGLVNRLLWMQDAYQLTECDRVLQKTPFSFDVSVWEFFWPLITGAQLVVAQPGGHQDSAYLVNLIAQQQITTLHFVPSMLQVFLEEKGLDKCASLRQVICSGEALLFDLQERFFERLGNCELHNLYGPTEAAIDVTFYKCQRGSHQKIVPIGRPIANTQTYILDSNLQPAPLGVKGELHIGGVQLARGYLNRPELTAEKFIPNPFSDEPDSRLYKTGDLARYLADGSIEYLGRIDHQVKLRGFRIELGEIESILSQHPQVREAVVIDREDQPGNKRLVAYLVPQQEPVSLGELRQFLTQKLPDYMVPSAFVELEAMPLTPNGKVDRKALPEPDSNTRHQTTYIMPQTEAEKLIAAVWQEVLQVEKVGIYDNFFELGGHSLLLIQVNQKLSEIFSIDLSIVDLFAYPNVHSLSQYIAMISDKKDSLETEAARTESRYKGKARAKEKRKLRQQNR